MPILKAEGGHTPPPARKPRASSAQTPKAVVTSREDTRAKREEGLNEFWGALSGVAIGLGWWADAGTLQMHGPTVTTEVVKYADTNEKIAAALDKFAEVAPIGGLVMAIGAMGIQLATNHGLMSPERGAMFGAVHPNAIATQTKARVERMMMEQQLRAAQEAQEAEAYRREVERLIGEGQKTGFEAMESEAS